MTLSEQTGVVNRGFENSTHSLFSIIAAALTKKIEEDTGMVVSFVGKTTTGKGSMSAVLVGEIRTDDVDGVDAKVRNIMSELKNPSNLIELIKND